MHVEPSLERLLEPSLSGRSLKAPYSVRAGFLVAFFGGLFSTLGFFALNSRRSERLKQDALFLSLATLVSIALVLTLVRLPEFRLTSRAAALLLFGAVFLRHRGLYAASELRGEDSPSAWGPGLLAIIGGGLLQYALAKWGATLGGL